MGQQERKKKVTKSNRKKIKAAASGCYNICSAYFVKQCIVVVSWVFGKQGLMWVAFPLSPLPPVHPRVKEIQSREPKVAEHEVERKREREKKSKKKQGKGKLIWEKKGFPRLHLSHLVKRPESVFLSPPPFFPTYLAHCRRLMAGFSNREKGFFPPLFPFFGGQQRRPALCYSFSPSPSFPLSLV